MSADPPLAFDTDAIEQAFGRLAGPTHLPSLTARERQHVIAEQLTPWVEQLVARFDLEIRVIPPCCITGSTQSAGSAWTDSGSANEDRSLKHRASKDVRHVPVHPELATILRNHVAAFDSSPDGRLFISRVGIGGRPLPRPFSKPLPMSTVYRAWKLAREEALREVASPMARQPYDLRHACLSTSLNAGVPATQVADWAGHSVNVLLRVYAKCVYGQEEVALRRIEGAIGGSS